MHKIFVHDLDVLIIVVRFKKCRLLKNIRCSGCSGGHPELKIKEDLQSEKTRKIEIGVTRPFYYLLTFKTKMKIKKETTDRTAQLQTIAPIGTQGAYAVESWLDWEG